MISYFISLSTFQAISLVIFLIYIVLILFYWYQWNKSEVGYHKQIVQKQMISVIIVGRNESTNLVTCINSIASNNYPKELYEIIYIDDFSSDNSTQLLSDIKIDNFKFYNLREYIGNNKINNYKKKAIEFAVSKSKGDIILQTDADVFVGSDWIISHASKYNNYDINFIAAPVLFKANKTRLEQFQKYDFITTMGITCAGINSKLHYMANGANMSFRKKVYREIDNNSNFASGDDMFLIQSIANKHPDSIGFLKDNNAIVYTFPEKEIVGFFKQRLRWATKTNGYENTKLKLVVYLVFLTSLIIVSNTIAIFFLNQNHLYFILGLIIIKLLVDSLFIRSISSFFKQEISFFDLIPSLLRYPFYILTIGVLSIFKNKYEWKKRIVK